PPLAAQIGHVVVEHPGLGLDIGDHPYGPVVVDALGGLRSRQTGTQGHEGRGRQGAAHQGLHDSPHPLWPDRRSHAEAAEQPSLIERCYSIDSKRWAWARAHWELAARSDTRRLACCMSRLASRPPILAGAVPLRRASAAAR